MTYTQEDAMQACLDYFEGDELAASSVVTKYLLKDAEGKLHERDPDQMHTRLAREFARIEEKFGGDRSLSMEDVYGYLEHFDKIIPQGSPMYGIGNDFSIVSLSNCVVVSSPEDDISSIINQGKDLANLFKRRCGVGIDISPLRPTHMPVSNSAGTTTGAWSFADFYSYVGRMIGQNGRRGALMITLDCKHPDVSRFATMKHDLTKVTGANISLKLRDDFMQAVVEDTDYTLQWPVDSDDPVVRETVRAREVWDTIVTSATKSGEPGLMMWDTILRELPAQCYRDKGFETVTTNPCGEIPLSPYDSCRLIALNLTGFVKNPFQEGAYFDFEGFAAAVSVAMRLSDDLVELEIEKLERILNKVDTEDEKTLWTKMLNACRDGRRTGLGTLGLADTMVKLGLTYATPEAVKMTDQIYEALKVEAYRESTRLAQERGTFKVWDWNLEKDNPYLQRLPKGLLKEMRAHGRRNISLLTNAPTGTASICAQTSSGIEPIFRLDYMRRKKMHPGDELGRVDFEDTLGDQWQEFQVYHHSVAEYMDKFGVSTDELPGYFVASDQIDWMGRIDMQAAVQRHIDHSISSCLVPDALIDTDGGLFYLDELYDFGTVPEGEFVENMNSNHKVLNHRGQRARIGKWYNNGIQRVYKITLKNGLQLRATGNERVLTESGGWIRLDELTLGTLVRVL